MSQTDFLNPNLYEVISESGDKHSTVYFVLIRKETLERGEIPTVRMPDTAQNVACPLAQLHIVIRDQFSIPTTKRKWFTRNVKGAIRDYANRTFRRDLTVKVVVRQGSIDILALAGSVTTATVVAFIKDYPKIREGAIVFGSDIRKLLDVIREFAKRGPGGVVTLNNKRLSIAV